MNSRGQIDHPVFLFAILIIALIIFAPVTLKIFREINTGFGNGLANVSQGGQIAKENFEAVTTPLINFWDKIMIAVFMILVILMMISSFLIDSHPVFIILYIFMNFMLIILAPNIIVAADNIYQSATYAQEVTLLPFMNTLRTYYAEILLGMMFISGVIIYAKVKLR